MFCSCQGQVVKSGDITVEQFVEEYNSSNDIVLDVRTPEEWASGIYPGAVKINFYEGDFDKKLKELDKSKNYFVYCKSGGRSSKTLTKMTEFGFNQAQNILGGATEMKAKGIELIKP